MDTTPQLESNVLSLKRKRSLSIDSPSHAPPGAKSSRSQNQLQINYLVRQYSDDLPLISSEEPLPLILSLLHEYNGVFERHESLAGNLGARPLGPMIIKRFERLFDGPPKVVKSHGGDNVPVSWLDVVDFARNKPDQFTLNQMSEGVPVCQFHTKQCHVQISEEDFELINSGMPQKLIPPQPILEDEEKELGTLEILEKNVAQISHLADQVAARARQFNHRLRGRKQAVIDRRSAETAITGAAALRASSPSNVALMNGAVGGQIAPQSPPPGFVAVQNPGPEVLQEQSTRGMANPAAISQTTRNELMKNFSAVAEKRLQSANHAFHQDLRQPTVASPRPQAVYFQPAVTTSPMNPLARLARASTTDATYDDFRTSLPPSYQGSPIPSAAANTPQLPTNTRTERDDGGAFKSEMVSRVEALSKGERIVPACDRCRRLHMDCLKNLTACLGCTKKHAKCSWKEVTEDELRATAHLVPTRFNNRTISGHLHQQQQQQQQQQRSHQQRGQQHQYQQQQQDLHGQQQDDTNVQNDAFSTLRQDLYSQRPYSHMNELADQAFQQVAAQRLAQAAAAAVVGGGVSGVNVVDLDTPPPPPPPPHENGNVHEHELDHEQDRENNHDQEPIATTQQMMMMQQLRSSDVGVGGGGGTDPGNVNVLDGDEEVKADPNVHPDLGGAPNDAVVSAPQAQAQNVHRLGAAMMVG